MAYKDFKDYVKLNYETELYDALRKFLDSYGWLSIARGKMDNLQVVIVHSKVLQLPHRIIEVDMKITVEISIDERSEKKWFDVQGDINLKKQFTVKNVNIATPEKDVAEKGVFSEFMLEDLSDEEMENMADSFWKFYCKDAIFDLYKFPFNTVLQKIHMYIEESVMPGCIMGRMYFRKTEISIYTKYPYPRGKVVETVEKIHPGTVVLNKQGEFFDEVGGYISVIAHEIVHWICHRNFFEILSLLNNGTCILECNSELQPYRDDLTGMEKAIWFAEWQANALGTRLVIPRIVFEELWHQSYAEVKKVPYKSYNRAEIFEQTIMRISKLCGVSKFVVKQRAIQLGKSEAIGTLLYVNNKYHNPVSFKPGVLKQGETFIVDEGGLEDLRKKNKYLQELLNTGKFVYLGYVVCINDAKYIENEDGKLDLTEYARNNVDECCLIFNLSPVKRLQDKRKYTNQIALNLEVSCYDYIEHNGEYKYDSENVNNKNRIALKAELDKIIEAKKETDKVLHKMYQDMQNVEGIKKSKTEFGKMLIFHMNRKGLKIRDLTDKINVSKQSIEKWRSGKAIPDLDNVMAIIIGLNLKPDYCWPMLEAAGYSLNSKEDKMIIYKMLIEKHTDGNLEQWNDIITAKGFPTIPYKRGQKEI